MRTFLIGTIMLAGCLIGTSSAGDLPSQWLTLGGKPADVAWQAQWIWDQGSANPRNYYLCARRDFENQPTDESLRLHISADSRYRLYLNGQWLGDGPARSFFWAQQFDTYDVTGLLKSGHNTIAVLVSHYGEGTFQYNPSGQAGLLVQLERQTGSGWQPILVTDEQWQVQQHLGYLRPTMRISCQMPFEEIIDARLFPTDWTMPTGQLPEPRPAKVIGPVGSGPWKTLVARSVPFLTREPVSPVRVIRTGLAQLPNFHTGFTTRPYLTPGHLMSNVRDLRGFAATIIESPADQTITFHMMSDRWEKPIINGVESEDGQPARLRKGDNLWVLPFGTWNIEYDRSYPAFVEQPIKLRGVSNDQTAWTIFGPFDNAKEVREKVRKVKSLEGLAVYRDKAQIVRQEDILTNGSPFDESTPARTVPGEFKADNLDGLVGRDSDVTTIYLSDAGKPEFFVDFGREVVGQIEFDVDAPSGTILTFNFIEEIEEGQRIHYCLGNQNAFRYITTAGTQQFTSFLRRGYRYAKVILSDMTGPVRIRSIRTIFASHPANERGSFSCSDPLLTKIWEIGRHTLRCCSEDTFTDCPAYEQTYWVGDGRNEALIDYAAYGNLALTRRCAELPILSLARKPITESQVPSAWDDILTGWWLLWIQMAEEHYQFSGDRDYLARVYPGVKLSLDNARAQYTDERGLLSIQAWNLFDWAGQDINHKTATHNQMWLAEALRRTAYMARQLGKTDDAANLDARREKLVAAINLHLWDEQRGAYIDSIHDDGTPSTVVSQQTNALAIAYNVAPPDRASRIKDVLVSPPKDMVTVGSPFALFYILEALAQQERYADILDIVRDRWGSMVDRGATSFWEIFPRRNAKWWTRSYCHAWSAAPTYFLSRYQLGVWWAEPGYTTARIAPQPTSLTWARGSVPTPHGSIHVNWHQSDQGFAIEVQLPPGVAGTVELPVRADIFKKVQSGDFKASVVNGQWHVQLPEGATASIKATR